MAPCWYAKYEVELFQCAFPVLKLAVAIYVIRVIWGIGIHCFWNDEKYDHKCEHV